MFYLLPYFELKVINFFGYSVASWKIFWWLGRAVTIVIMLREAERLKLSKRTIWVVFLSGLVFISFFEKLLFFLSQKYLHANVAAPPLLTYAGWNAQGRVYFGALIGIFLSLIVGTVITGQWRNARKYFDVNLLAQVANTFFYRIGNLLWHSHLGAPTSFFLGMPDRGQVRHEVSLYELISLGLLFAVAWPLRRKISRPGFLSLFVLGWISLSRLITDSFRDTGAVGANFHFANGFTFNQLVYGTILLIEIVIIITVSIKSRTVKSKS